jgi:hypothetical protein
VVCDCEISGDDGKRLYLDCIVLEDRTYAPLADSSITLSNKTRSLLSGRWKESSAFDFAFAVP